MASAVQRAYLDVAEWVPVRSTNISAIWYQSDFAYLWVRFRNGRIGYYETVPSGVAAGFLAAPSKGRYVYYVLRNGGKDDLYPFSWVA